MKFVKYAFAAICFLVSAFLLYFLYHIRHREQIPIQLEGYDSVKMARNLLIYESPEITLERHGNLGDGGYVVSKESLEKSDILLGYGIADDNVFEDNFSLKYQRPSYGFDCGIENIRSKSELFHFKPICIANADSLYKTQKNSQNILSFREQVEKFGLGNKRIFIKMDIEGAEYEAMQQILEYSDQLTGIALELHIWNESMVKDAIDLLERINEQFYLIHIHGNNYAKYIISSDNIKGRMPSILELSFINKNMVQDAKISSNQSHPSNLDRPNCGFRADNIFGIKL